MITIRTKNPQFRGERAGVQFRDGEARVEELSGRQRQALRELGYTVEDPNAARTLADLRNDELRRLAEREGIDLAGATKKVDMIAAIEAAQAASQGEKVHGLNTRDQAPPQAPEGTDGEGGDTDTEGTEGGEQGEGEQTPEGEGEEEESRTDS